MILKYISAAVMYCIW